MPLRHENDGGAGYGAADADAAAGRLLLARLRAVFAICLGAFALFALADLQSHPRGLALALGVKTLQVLVVVAGFVALARPRSRTAVGWIGAATMAFVYVTAAIAGGLRGSYGPAVLLLVVCCMGTATMLAWGARRQAFTVAAAAVALLGNVWAVAGSLAPLSDGHAGLGVALALLGSVYVAWESDRHRRETLTATGRLAGQGEVLEMIARGAPLSEILEALTVVVERQAPGLWCSILLLEGDQLRHGAAPSLPQEYAAAIDGVVIGPTVGSCGTAAYTRRPVVVTDIAVDPLWDDFRHVALPHGLRACWSAPILSTDGCCLGTLAMYYGEPRGPSDEDGALIAFATHLAGIAIERHRIEAALARSRLELEQESRVSTALARVGAEMIAAFDTPLILARLCALTTDLLECDASSTVLRQASDDVYALDAGHGYAVEEWETLRLLRMPGAMLRPVLDRLRASDLLQFPTGRIPDPLLRRMFRKHGVHVSLYVPLRRGDEIVGFLGAVRRRGAEPFTAVQERIARGIGQLASMALEHARLVEELKSASQLKSEFVSTMSHELRTPLSVIIGYTDMLADEPDPDERAGMLDRIRRSSRELLELIEATLNLNRLEAGRDPVDVEIVPLPALFEELAAEFAALKRPPGVALRFDADPGLAAWTDRRKLRIIVKNLVGNALKFTAAGEVEVTARREPAGAVLSVRDTGVGIAPEHLPLIFDMFRQADSSDARSYGGVGLGLYIVRRLLGLLGGTIDVASVAGRGTTFTVTLPDAERANDVQADAR